MSQQDRTRETVRKPVIEYSGPAQFPVNPVRPLDSESEIQNRQ